MTKYVLFIDGSDRGVFYANDDDMAYRKAEVLVAVMGYYVPDVSIEVERI